MKTRKNIINIFNKTKKNNTKKKNSLVDKVNEIYQNSLNIGGKHLFFFSRKGWNKSSEGWNKEFEDYSGYKSIDYNPTNIDQIKTIEGCNYTPKEVYLHKDLLKLFEYINDPTINKFDLIKNKLEVLCNYNAIKHRYI